MNFYDTPSHGETSPLLATYSPTVKDVHIAEESTSTNSHGCAERWMTQIQMEVVELENQIPLSTLVFP